MEYCVWPPTFRASTNERRCNDLTLVMYDGHDNGVVRLLFANTCSSTPRILSLPLHAYFHGSLRNLEYCFFPLLSSRPFVSRPVDKTSIVVCKVYHDSAPTTTQILRGDSHIHSPFLTVVSLLIQWWYGGGTKSRTKSSSPVSGSTFTAWSSSFPFHLCYR